MPQVTGIGTTWNLPNYAGELFTADPTQTPFLSMIGGLTGGRQTDFLPPFFMTSRKRSSRRFPKVLPQQPR